MKALIGKYVVTRINKSGIIAGELVAITSHSILLKNAVRGWRWKTKSGIGDLALATHGIQEGKIDRCALVHITREEGGVIAVCTPEARKSWEDVK